MNNCDICDALSVTDRCCYLVAIQTGATSVQKTASVNTTRQTAAPVTNSRTGATASQQPQPATDRMLRSASTKPPASAARLQVCYVSVTIC